jgi:RimJ/RimL family protein N-acetyltransferase
MTSAAQPVRTLRLAAPGDCQLFWQWANDTAVRSMAFHREPIPWESHQRWFAARLASARSHLFVLEDAESKPVGQIRFDEGEDGVFEIDLSIASGHRGSGIGQDLLSKGEALLRQRARVSRLRALVKLENTASLNLFRRAGYDERGITQGPGGTPAMLLEKSI